MPKFQICDVTSDGIRIGLAFYEGDSAEDALMTYLRDRLHASTLLDNIVPGTREPREEIKLKGPPDAVLHTENGLPAAVWVGGEKYHAVPVN